MYPDEIQSWVTMHQEVWIPESSLGKPIENVGFSYESLRKAAAKRDEDGREGFRAWAREALVPRVVVIADGSRDRKSVV